MHCFIFKLGSRLNSVASRVHGSVARVMVTSSGEIHNDERQGKVAC